MGCSRKLSLAVGMHPDEGYVNLDKDPRLPGINVLWDCEKIPWPFNDCEFEEIKAYEILAYTFNVVPIIDECWRIIQPDGLLRILVPLCDRNLAWVDPHFVRPYHRETFDHFDPDLPRGQYYHWYTTRRWRITRKTELPNGNFICEMRRRG